MVICIRPWVIFSIFVGKILKEITFERLINLQKCYQAIGFKEEDARQQALLAYSVYVGYLHLAKTMHGKFKDTENIENYAQFVADQLIPEPRNWPSKLLY